MRRSVRALVALFLFIPIAAACGSDTDSSESSASTPATDEVGGETSAGEPELDPDGVVRLAWAGPLQTWDPVTASTPGISEGLFPPVYDRLIFRNATGRGAESLSPMLAKSWETSDDGMSTSVKLRDDVTFQDGAPLDAEGVKYSFDRLINFPGSVAAPQFANVASIDVVDPYTVRFNLKEASFTFPHTLAGSSAWVVSPNASMTEGVDAPAGSGPYVWVPEESTATKQVYVPNTDYWGMDQPFAPKLARLEIHTIGDDAARFRAYQSGQVDLVVSRINQHDDAEQIASSMPDTTLYSTPSMNASFVLVNATDGPLANESVRRAMSMAIDRDAINEALLSGAGTVTDQVFMDGAPGHLPDRDMQEYDPEAARALIEEADLGPITLELVTYANQAPSTVIAEALQAAWAEIGVTVNINKVDNGVAQPEWIAGNYDLFSTTVPYQGSSESTLDERLTGTLYVGEKPAELGDLEQTAAGLPLGSDERDEAYQAVNEYIIDHALAWSIASFPTEYLGKSNIWNADKMPTSNQSTTFNATVLGVVAE